MLTVEHVWVKRRQLVTLEDVTLSLSPGKTLAVIGESGAGKSTLIAAILGLVPLWRGTIDWTGDQVRPSLVMQEPRAAFNPAQSLYRSVMEPLLAQKQELSKARLQTLCDGLELPAELLQRRPHEVSIGQAQRIGILRALIASPPLILFDEPLSALDAVTQKHTARLIANLQIKEGFSALIVTHDLGYACAFADEIAVLRSGRIEEVATVPAFMERPKSDYGRVLRNAAIDLGSLELSA